MLMVNYFLSTLITIFPDDGLFIYKEPAAKLCGIYHYDVLRANTKFLQKHYKLNNLSGIKLLRDVEIPKRNVMIESSHWHVFKHFL